MFTFIIIISLQVYLKSSGFLIFVYFTHFFLWFLCIFTTILRLRYIIAYLFCTYNVTFDPKCNFFPFFSISYKFRHFFSISVTLCIFTVNICILSQSRRLPLLQVMSNNKSFSVGVQSPTEIKYAPSWVTSFLLFHLSAQKGAYPDSLNIIPVFFVFVYFTFLLFTAE